MVLLAAIDQGTSSSRFLVFEADSGELLASHQIEVQQLFPNPGWVEMNPIEIVDTVKECMTKVAEQLESLSIAKYEIKSIGIANQRETTVVWDSETGMPLWNAIVWLDNRTEALAEESIKRTPSRSKDEFKRKTGLPIHPYFSALKLKWLMENVDIVKEANARGKLMFGTIDTWLIWKLTGEHVTDVTNASRTLLFDLHKRKWSTEMCEFFDIPQQILPKIKSSAEIYGHLTSGPFGGVAIAGCLGDQQAAMVGHNCLNRGDTKNTYGTGTFMLCNIGTNLKISKSGLLTTVGYQLGPESPLVFAFEGSGSIGGNVVRFLRDNFNFIKDASEMEEICRSVDSTEGVVFVPCFTGLYTPYWDPTAKGTILGLTQVTTKAHICLAALQAVAFQSAEMLEEIQQELEDTPIHHFSTDGGMTANVLFNEIQSDIIGKPIKTLKITEITGWGAAVAAGIGSQQICLDAFSSKQPPVFTTLLLF
ncbi:glycerol kinase [Dictyocaulus viviparus]|uniref:Probable glycerol kinase n=1 Tax=Dictyocaulus viviparus TaxID=29172 RepID=A0A0D8Y755_DICVI|nr:glycerol kinase [Dictyocaulus viviparus]